MGRAYTYLGGAQRGPLGFSALLNLALGTTYDVAADFSGGTPKWVRI